MCIKGVIEGITHFVIIIRLNNTRLTVPSSLPAAELQPAVLQVRAFGGWWPVMTGNASSLRGTVINPGAVKLGRKPSATSHRYLSTFQWNQLLLQRASVPTLYVLFLQTNRVWLWKERQTWSRKPSWAASTGCKIYLKSVSMETHWCVREAWRTHKAFYKAQVNYYYCSSSDIKAVSELSCHWCFLVVSKDE